MTTQSALHPIHHLLAILAGEAPAPDSDAATDALARVVGRLGFGALQRDTLEPDGAQESAPWFVRVTFPGIAPPDAFITSVATAAGLHVESLAHGPAFALESRAGRATAGMPSDHSRWLLVAPQPRAAISSAVRQLRAAHRIHAVPFRQTEGR
jgi:hypothetical protein